MLFFILKLYPVLGISLGVLSWDLMRISRRRGNAAWLGMAFFAVFFAITTLLWLGFRGDVNAERWFSEVSHWLAHQ